VKTKRQGKSWGQRGRQNRHRRSEITRYWLGEDCAESPAVVTAGGGWLEGHPQKRFSMPYRSDPLGLPQAADGEAVYNEGTLMKVVQGRTTCLLQRADSSRRERECTPKVVRRQTKEGRRPPPRSIEVFEAGLQAEHLGQRSPSWAALFRLGRWELTRGR